MRLRIHTPKLLPAAGERGRGSREDIRLKYHVQGNVDGDTKREASRDKGHARLMGGSRGTSVRYILECDLRVASGYLEHGSTARAIMQTQGSIAA